MTQKKDSKKSKKNDSKKVNALISTLSKELKIESATVRAICELEKTLLAQKANKESAKQKVTRQKMRNRKFYRNEHTADTIAKVQKIASLI